MTLEVSASLTAGDLRYDGHASRLRLRRGVLPIGDRLDYWLPRNVRFEAAPGDDLSLELDGGDGSKTVFTGTISSVRRDFTGVRIVGHNGGRLLAGYRPSVSLEQVSIGDVVQQLCNDVSVDINVGGGPTLARYVANARSTAMDEITRLMHLAGLVAAFDGGGTLVAHEGSPANEHAVLYGREVLAIETGGPLGAMPQRSVFGEGASEPGSASALWPTADFWSGSATTPGPGVIATVAHELRTIDDARAAAAAQAGRDAAAATSTRLSCWLLPDIGPNDSVEVHAAPDDLAAAVVRVRQVVHHIDPRRAARTEIHGFDDGAAGEGVFGAALASIGGLL